MYGRPYDFAVYKAHRIHSMHLFLLLKQIVVHITKMHRMHSNIMYLFILPKIKN